jgi:hypothetical protein
LDTAAFKKITMRTFYKDFTRCSTTQISKKTSQGK